MSRWKLKVGHFVEGIDRVSDRVRAHWRKLRGYKKPLQIVPYLGYGTADKFHLSGRVVAGEGEISSAETDNRKRNLINFFRRFATREVPYARIRARFESVEKEVTADDEGYFLVELSSAEPVAGQPLFHEIELELIEPVSRKFGSSRAVGRVLVPPPTARFGIISDIDDTVITTDVTSKLRMLFNTALLNEYTRKPFEGVSAFYKALQKGQSGSENNPIFYVSSSPWNLYPFLTEFLRINDIPLGPLFLKDFGNHTIFAPNDHAGHKIKYIEDILNTYTHLQFVLIGDSGERDPEIYQEIVHKYPNRIRVIYIRSVNQRPERLAAIDHLVAEIAETGCQLVLAADTEFAAAHAAAEKLIAVSEISVIREEKKSDELAPPQE